MNDKGQRRPWYREKLVWMLISLPASAVIAGIATIILATRTSDGLVADDYYKQGLAINQVIARDEEARRLGLSADIRVVEGKMSLSLNVPDGMPLPDRLLLTLVHPTRSGEDHEILLTRQTAAYVGESPVTSAGRWQLKLEDESRKWRISGTAYFPAETTIRIESEIPKS